MKEIALSRGYTAKVDDQDFLLFSGFHWYALVLGRRYGLRVYAICYFREGERVRHQLMHRLLLGAPSGLEVDHVDGDGLNNRRENLRVCSGTQNKRNRKRNVARNGRSCASEFKGVTFDRGWIARIVLGGGKRKYLGRHKTEAAAARAYDEAARSHFGEYAALNFPRVGEVAA